MAPTAIFNNVSVDSSDAIHQLKASLKRTPETLLDVLEQSVARYPNHELGFITSSAHDSSIQTKTFREFEHHARSLAQAMLAWGNPTGSVVVVYLTEHEENMLVVWACLLAGLVPCLQPALSAQQSHKEGHVGHIKGLFGSAIWLTNETGAEQLLSIPDLEIHLYSELKESTAVSMSLDFKAHEPNADDEALLFLTSGSTGFSKAVVHTHRTLLAACHAKGASYGLTSDTKIINCERESLTPSELES